ncbi:MAG: sigma-70 family RNA polymerase sigma factor [Bacteroidetes bacterium]|nr:sigma-70 family RNA polymerase sigma factor [Bacteroidota bacterium]
MDSVPPGIDWSSLYHELLAAAHVMIRMKAWARGHNTDALLMGQQADDFVQEAITNYLENQDKFDPTKGSLKNYLIKCVLRTVVTGNARRKENVTSEVASYAVSDGMDGEEVLRKEVEPFVNAYFDEEIDFSTIQNYVKKQVNGDENLVNIFLGLCEGLPPRDIQAMFELSEQSYHNDHRRLQTVLRHTVTEFKLTSPVSTRK